MKWVNRTAYSQKSDKSEIRTTMLELTHITIVVSKHIHHDDELIMSCNDLNISVRSLNVTDMQEGQALAIEIVKNELKDMLGDLTKLEGKS